MNAATSTATVYIIDDDESVRRALRRLLRSAGFQCVGFASIQEFLMGGIESDKACAIVDIRLDQDSGLRIPGLLAARGCRLPVIFLTGSDSEELRERARSLGAAALLRKPVDDQALLDVTYWALGAR